MEIIKTIKSALKKAGVDEQYAERIQKLFNIEKDENIDVFVSLFKENVLPAITEAEEKAGKDASSKAVEEYEKKFNLKDGAPVKTGGIEGENDVTKNMTPEIKALFEAQQKSIKDLTELVSGVVKTSTNAQKLAEVKEKLKGKIDEKFIDRVSSKVNLDAEDLNAEIEAQANDFNSFKQSLIDEYVGGNYVPNSGRTPEKSEKEWADFMNGNSGDDKAGVVNLGL